MAQFTVLDKIGNDLVIGTDTGVTGVISEALLPELGLVPDRTIGITQIPPDHRPSEWHVIVFDHNRTKWAVRPDMVVDVSYEKKAIPLELWRYGKGRSWRFGWNQYDREWIVQKLTPE